MRNLHAFASMFLLACTTNGTNPSSQPGNGVVCGDSRCDAICCSADSGTTCLADAASCAYDRIHCDGPEDCNTGEVCCQSYVALGPQYTYCNKAIGDLLCKNLFERVVCHKDVDCEKGTCGLTDGGIATLTTCH